MTGSNFVIRAAGTLWVARVYLAAGVCLSGIYRSADAARDAVEAVNAGRANKLTARLCAVAV